MYSNGVKSHNLGDQFISPLPDKNQPGNLKPNGFNVLTCYVTYSFEGNNHLCLFLQVTTIRNYKKLLTP